MILEIGIRAQIQVPSKIVDVQFGLGFLVSSFERDLQLIFKGSILRIYASHMRLSRTQVPPALTTLATRRSSLLLLFYAVVSRQLVISCSPASFGISQTARPPSSHSQDPLLHKK